MALLETPPALVAAIQASLAGIKVRLPAQVEALAELFELFTAERRRLHRLNYLDTPRHRLAYLRYHLPLNVVRTICVLQDLLPLHHDLAGLEQVVDIGAGPGSCSIGALLTLPPADRRYLLADKSRGGLRLARELFEQSQIAAGLEAAEVHCQVQKLPELPRCTRPSLVMMGMVLNELQPDGRRGLDLDSLFRRLAERLAESSVLVIIEPAIRAAGLRLMALHDALVDSGRWTVLAPCTHQRDCPLLGARNRPWCHFHFGWKAGSLVERIAAPLGLDCAKGAFSYLALRRTDGPVKEASDASRIGRAIGDRMRVRGGEGIYVCRDGKRETLTRPPAEMKRGDRVRGGKGPRPARIEKAWPA